MVRRRSGQIIWPPVHLIDEIDITTTEINYDVLLAEVDQEIENCEVYLVGSGLGSGFNDTAVLHVMKFVEAMNWPNGKAWKWEGENEHEKIIKHKVWVPVMISQIPK